MKHRFLVVLVFCLVLMGCQKSGPKLTIHSESGDSKVYIEVARTQEEKRVGLMGRTEMKDDTGMLFVYDSGSSPVMWMKNMLMPIDMLFIGDDLKVNHLEKSIAPCKERDDSLCDRYSSFELSSYVLELPAGYAEKQGIEVGDQVELELGLEAS